MGSRHVQVDTEARNFGRDKHPEHGTRYEMAQEFVDVVAALWDSWPQDSLVMNRASGTFVDESKLRVADYKGQWYSTQGLLNVSSSTARLPRPYSGQVLGSWSGFRRESRRSDLYGTDVTRCCARFLSHGE